MSGERHEPLVHEFEQELRQALMVEPSPEFASRVRARIAARSAASHRRRWSVGLAAAAVCVLAIGIGWRATAVRPLPTVATTRAGSDVRLPDGSATPAPDSGATETPVRVRAPVGMSKPAAAEPIVPPDRARALARLLTLARSGAVDEESLRPVAPAAAPAMLRIAPIVVPSIAVPTVETRTGVPQEDAGRE